MKLLLPLLFLLFISLALAVPAAPSPYCSIKAEVISVEFKAGGRTAIDSICQGRELYDRYQITARIEEVKTETQEGAARCEERYAVGSEVVTVIAEPELSNNETPEPKDVISGAIHFGGDECANGNYFTEYPKIEKQIKENYFIRFWHWLISFFR